MLGRAMNLARDADVAEDLVQAAFIDALQIDSVMPEEETIYFLFSIIKNRWLNERRHRQTRRLTIAADDIGAEVDRIQSLGVRPAQQPCAELSEAIRELDKLEPLERQILALRATEHDDKEIAKLLGINAKTVKRHGDHATATIRDALGMPPLEVLPRSRSGFRGVSPLGRQWQANHGSGPDRLYLGLYDDVEEAALAVDLAALWRRGPDASLNFPDLRDDLLARVESGERPTSTRERLGSGRVSRNQILVAEDIPAIRARIVAGEPQKTIASDYGVHFNVISEIKRGTRWAHVA